MEIVNFGKQGFANRFCRELADSIANTWVWAQGSEAERLPPSGLGDGPSDNTAVPITFKIKQTPISIEWDSNHN